MALQNSGVPISIDDIRTELEVSTGSLRSLSSTAGKSTPDAMSEFYSYTHATLTSFTGSTSQSSSFAACLASLTQTYYHDGSGTIPVAGDIVYINSTGTSALGSGTYRSWSGGYMVLTFGTGLVSSTGNCGGCMIEGTEITLSDGSITTIENLMIGDSLGSLAIETIPDTSADCVDCVDDLLAWNTKEIVSSSAAATVITNEAIEVDAVIDINNGLLKSSLDHVHLIKRLSEWTFKRASDIEIGDMLLNNDNKEIEILTIDTLSEGPYLVYKLNVETNDVFYANGILTHNAK